MLYSGNSVNDLLLYHSKGYNSYLKNVNCYLSNFGTSRVFWPHTKTAFMLVVQNRKWFKEKGLGFFQYSESLGVNCMLLNDQNQDSHTRKWQCKFCCALSLDSNVQLAFHIFCISLLHSISSHFREVLQHDACEDMILL